MIAAGRVAILFSLGIASCAPTGDHGRMKRMHQDEAVSVLKATLEPLLVNAGFTRDHERWPAAPESLMAQLRYTPVGGRWTSRRGDAIRSVDFGVYFNTVVLRAGIGFAPALKLLQTADPDLDLSYETVPASDLLQLFIHRGVHKQVKFQNPLSGPDWSLENLTAAALAESVSDTFQTHVLAFFERTSTIDAVLWEVDHVGEFGDCGPMSYFEPRINKFFLAAFYKERGDRENAIDIVEKELAAENPSRSWAAFRDWIVGP